MKDIHLHRRHKAKQRHKRVFKRVKKSNDHLRVRVVKTNAHIYALVIDDRINRTLFASSSLQLKLSNGNKANALLVGQDLVRKLQNASITAVCFDRGGSKYHGRVAVIAQTLRQNGIKV